MVHNRGNRADSDAWRDEFGREGWGDDDLPPSFRRAEETLRPEPVRDVHPLSQAWFESASSTPR
jgi:choline dehydrogenase-like flavoprotein